VRFERIHGHDRLRAVLGAALDRGRVPQSLLFSGPAGVGKHTVAVEVARALVCPAGGCDRCAVCDRVRRGIHPDVVEVAGTTKTGQISVDQLRDLIPEIGSRPFEAQRRVFVFDADALNDQSSNAMLKILEEPPPTSHLVLISAAPHALLTTIRSRCQQFRFGALPVAVVEQALVERGVEAGEARVRAALSGGSLGHALALESDAWQAARVKLLDTFEALPTADALARAGLADRLVEGVELAVALTLGRSLLRDVAALAAGVGEAAVVNADVLDRLQGLADGPVGAAARAMADVFGRSRDLLEGIVDGELRQGGSKKEIIADLVLDEAAAALGA
jgi:DNA polymerase-3 subunit delta'